MKVVFVDDQKDIIDAYADLFKRNDLELYTFSDSVIAQEEIRKIRPTLCFIDYKMPTINGVELRNNLKDLTETQFYLITGEDTYIDGSEFLEVIKKPKIANKIQRIIEASQS